MNDLISRKEAIETINSLTVHVSGVDVFPPEGKKSVIETLDLLPGVPLHNKWISVKDRLPEFPRFVLVYVKHPASDPFPSWSCIMTDMYLGDRWAENADEEVHEVTHWMPLPEPPKEENE